MALPDNALPAADRTSPLAWHALTADHAADRLGVDHTRGLSANEAAERLLRHGPVSYTHLTLPPSDLV